MSRVALADPGTFINCPCCGKRGRKDAKYALIVECKYEYKRKKNAEWQLKHRPPKPKKTQEEPVTQITKTTKTKSFIAMDSASRDQREEQERLEEHKRVFAAAGGKIQQIPVGVSGMAPLVPGKRVHLNLKAPARRAKKSSVEEFAD